MGDHAETVRIAYDPAVISYEDLLREFWGGHRPTSSPWSRQYMSAIFFTSAEQQRLALSSKAEEERRLGTKLFTEIVPAGPFYPAEDYHQKYTLRRFPEFMNELKERYGSDKNLVLSTAAARINGYLAGYGGCRNLKDTIHRLALSPATAERLLEIGCGTVPREICPLP